MAPPPPGGGSRREWAILLISAGVFACASAYGSGEEAAHNEDEAHTQRDYYAELKPHVVAGESKRLSNGQILHGYRLAIADESNDLGFDDGKGRGESRHRRDTATTKVFPKFELGVATDGEDPVGFKKEYNYYTMGKASAYLGVPYAQRPINDLTFARPVPINYTINPRLLNCRFQQTNRNNGDVCPQNINGIIIGNKDCLYLNIIAPELEESASGYAALYPVMVFFHSGSLKEGGAYVFGPLGIVQNLVRRGMVVVTLQYRIGVYGFMNLNGTIANITNNSARGMYDQVEALRWIQRNIGAFKGDLKQVTLVGAGSGACCAALLYYASVTKEGWPVLNSLFHRLILQSGSSDTCRVGGFRSDYHKGSMRTSSTEYGKATDCRTQSNAAKLVQCLQAQPLNYVLANTDVQMPYPIWDFELPDGYLRYSADAAYAASTYTQKTRKKIDVLIGMTRDEFASYDVSFMTRFKWQHYTYRERMKKMLEYVSSNYSDSDADAFIARIVQLYRPGEKEPSDDNSTVSFWYDLYVEAFTDYMVASSILLDARRLAALGNKVYLYKIFVGTNGFFQNDMFLNSTHNIVPHAIELPYIFMPERVWDDSKLTSETATAEMFGQLWYNFVSSGKVKGIGGDNGTGMDVGMFDGTINLATGEIGPKNMTKSGYNMVFDYLFIGNYTSYPMKSNEEDAVFIRDGMEQFWTEWKYEQLTHYQPIADPKTNKPGKQRSGKLQSEPRDLAKKHREERLRSLSEP